MRYVVSGYVFVLTVLALYAVQLIWRRRRLTRAVARVTGPDAPTGVATVVDGGGVGRGPAVPTPPGDPLRVEAT